MLRIFLILVISASILFASAAFGQQLSMGEKPVEDIVVTIDENGNAHVVHQVQMNNDKPVQVDMINGNITNFSVTDQRGGSVQYSTISQSPMAVLLFPSNRNMTLINYDLDDVVSLDKGVWLWDYYEPQDASYTDFHFPKGVDMIWMLSDDKSKARAAYFGVEKGIRQIGNGVHLAFIINEPVTTQTVKWQDKTFYVGVRTLANLGDYVFDRSAKSYAFNVDQPNSFITIIMPQELLWGPYQATINTNATITTLFHKNGTHAWIGIRPAHSGTVQITGTTVIPEFPLLVPLAIAVSAVVALRFFNKLSFK